MSRLVRMQLAIFSIAGIIGVFTMVFVYMQAPTMLGIGKITLKMQLPSTGGLYRFSNVTYRGVQIGRVISVVPTGRGAEATLSINDSPKVPADLQAEVHSVSAIGEMYVDLVPRTDNGPYLGDGSVIALDDTTIPRPIGPMLDRASALVDSIPKDSMGRLLDETFKGLDGAGYDLGSLFDSTSTIAGKFNGASDQTSVLIEDVQPLLESQADSTDAIRLWARSLAGFTAQVAQNDPQVRTLLQKGPGLAHEATRLLDQLKPTLPILLANLTSFGEVGVTYNPSIEQMLILFPPFVTTLQAALPWNNATGLPTGEFRATLGDPPACTVGFLPPSSWRSPADTTTIDTPDGLYCKLPQDSPITVRGARNYPCMGVPGKRAPTVQECQSDKPFQPLALRQHALGPYPFDPNLIAQGVPPDDRVTRNENIFGPLEGTPRPPGPPPGSAPAPPPPDGAGPAETVPGVPEPTAAPEPLPPDASLPVEPQIPQIAPSDAGVPGNLPASPSSFSTNTSGSGSSAAVVHYDPRTGRYLGPDGRWYQQSDLVDQSLKSWKDLVLTPS